MVEWCPSVTVCLVAVAGALSGCVAVQRPIHNQTIDHLGRFEYRTPQSEMAGVVIGAPHGGTASGTAALARLISDRTGAGFVAAYGFKSKQVSVEQPVVRSSPYQPVPIDPLRRRSVFAELKQILRNISGGELDLYIGIRPRHTHKTAEGIEVVASGFTFEELRLIDRAYIEIRDRYIGARAIEKLPLLFAPVDKVTLVASGIRHHCVLMIAEKGVSLGIPEKVLSGANLSVYGQVFSEWTKKLERLVHDGFRKISHVQVRMIELGRLDSAQRKKPQRLHPDCLRTHQASGSGPVELIFDG